MPRLDYPSSHAVLCVPPRFVIGLLPVFSLLAWAWWHARAESPAPLAEVAPLEDIVHEIGLQQTRLTTLLASEESFAEHREGEVRQAFGVLACLGQALAEHPARGESQVNGPALRDAALIFRRDGDLAQAQTALAACVEAIGGGGAADAATHHPWERLVGMHAMMEEINSRNAQIARMLRRPRGDADSIANASTIAILALAMEADTHEVKDDADLPDWRELSLEYRREMIGLAEALRTNDAAAVRMHFTAANEACDRCHEKFRDN